MYNQLYLWANNNFKLLCICILVVVFAMVFISALMKHRRRMHICWISLFIVYLLMLAFIRGIIRMCEQVAASGNTLILYSA